MFNHMNDLSVIVGGKQPFNVELFVLGESFLFRKTHRGERALFAKLLRNRNGGS